MDNNPEISQRFQKAGQNDHATKQYYRLSKREFLKLPTYAFSTAQNKSVSINVTEKEKSESGNSSFAFEVHADAPEDAARVAGMIKNTIAAVLSGEARVTGESTVEWSGQSSLNSTQLMSTIKLNLESLGITPPQKKQSGFRSMFSRFGRGSSNKDSS